MFASRCSCGTVAAGGPGRNRFCRGCRANVGTIAAGKQADLVVIKGDPSKKIEDIENVETFFKDGIGYDSAKLTESVRGVVGSG